MNEARSSYDAAATAVHGVVTATTTELQHVTKQAQDVFGSIAKLTVAQVAALEKTLASKNAELVAFEQRLEHESAQFVEHLVVESPRVAFLSPRSRAASLGDLERAR